MSRQIIRATCPLCGDELEFPFHFWDKEERATLQTAANGNILAFVNGALDNVDHSNCTGLVKNTI